MDADPKVGLGGRCAFLALRCCSRQAHLRTLTSVMCVVCGPLLLYHLLQLLLRSICGRLLFIGYMCVSLPTCGASGKAEVDFESIGNLYVGN